METQKVFVRDNIVEVTCPSCSNTQKAKVDRESLKKHILNVKCKCSHVFRVELESRKHFRKETSISAYYRNLTKEKDQTEDDLATQCHYGTEGCNLPPNCTVKNISERGIGFETKRRHLIEKGDEIQIEFSLDNVAETEICQRLIVRGVFGNFIGSEFAEDTKYETTLKFYLEE